ncbi:MAG: hypothetical protein J3R72DRAFT_446829 [Linnemannia gamsii]|nr:MAG: hypothetical protein J3R72DRAFT_446829 [Linnemannia gamsii]
MRNSKTFSSSLLLVILSFLFLSAHPTHSQGDNGSPWCQKYMTNCEDLRKLHCDRKVPNNDRTLTSIAAHCSTAVSQTGGCRYFSPDCSCSWTNVADMNRTVFVPLGGLALERTNVETKNECKDANLSPPPSTTTPTATSALPITPSPTTTTPSSMAGDTKKPMAVSLATINVAILLAALFL